MGLLNKKSEKQETQSTLAEEFKAEKEREVSRPTTRRVRLKASSCCGCGCHDVDIMREVPFDSPLNDGDHVTRIEDDDEII